jgi:hypothetical protein
MAPAIFDQQAPISWTEANNLESSSGRHSPWSISGSRTLRHLLNEKENESPSNHKD